MSEIGDLIAKLNQFRDERDWRQFHKPKDLAISLCLEAAEVLEHFQWKNEEEIIQHSAVSKEQIGEELADVFIYLLQLTDEFGIDIMEATYKKIVKNSKKYPVQKCFGKHN